MKATRSPKHGSILSSRTVSHPRKTVFFNHMLILILISKSVSCAGYVACNDRVILKREIRERRAYFFSLSDNLV
jgi:hypothetical protein